MSQLDRILLVRHGETVGLSSVRFHGRTDVALSDEGRAQLRVTARRLPLDRFDQVVASPLARAWEAASIILPGRPILLEARFREIDFGHWEGLTAQEIELRDPRLYRAWREQANGFEYPSGEKRAAFQSRVRAGLDALLAGSARSVLLVSHKGVIREIARALCDAPLEPGEPPLAGVVQLIRTTAGPWTATARSSRSTS